MTRKFEDILDECLDRIARGESIERCLQDYPHAAEKLEPLLRTALTVAQKSQVMPRPEFKVKAKQHLLREAPIPTRKPKWASLFRPRWALAALSVMTFLLIGGGTIVASANSLPDQPLYPVKLATEQIQFLFSRSPVSKAKLEARFADRRIDELSEMAKKRKLKEVEKTVERLNMHIERMGRIAEAYRVRGKARDLGEMRNLFIKRAAQHTASLQKILPYVPEKTKPVIVQAMRNSKEKHAHAIKALSKHPPREVKQWIASGSIQSMTENLLIVDDYVIEITPDTIIQGKLEVGRRVSVKMNVKPDGSLQALEVKSRE